MHKKFPHDINFFILAILLSGSIVISSCAPGQLFGPTMTPTPTLTPTPTPTATPDPIVLALREADQFWQSGKTEDAISKYDSILKESTDPTMRDRVFAALEEIGLQTLTQANIQYLDSGSHEELDTACETYKIALAAYEPILRAQDRPAFEQDAFYSDAAKVEVALIPCLLWHDHPEKSFAEVISILLENLIYYPNEPEIMNILMPAILDAYKDEVDREFSDKSQEVIHNGQLIISTAGEYQVNGEKMADLVNKLLLEEELCSGNPVLTSNVGTSATRKIFACDWVSTTALERTDLLATAMEPSEIWYTLQMEYDGSPELKCTGYRTDTGTTFFYSYVGQQNEIFTLKDVQSGKIMATKTFWGTAPRCVFYSCNLNTFTNTATCNGGEGQSTYDEAVLIQWISNNLP